MFYITTSWVIPIPVIDIEYVWLHRVPFADRLFASRFIASIVTCASVSMFVFVSHFGGRSRCFRFVLSLTGHWPMSQTANEVSSVCSVCQTVRQINIKDSIVHSHDPRNNSCPGSDILLLAAAAALATAQPVSRSQPTSNLPPRLLRPPGQPHPVHIPKTPATFVNLIQPSVSS